MTELLSERTVIVLLAVDTVRAPAPSTSSALLLTVGTPVVGLTTTDEPDTTTFPSELEMFVELFNLAVLMFRSRAVPCPSA